MTRRAGNARVHGGRFALLLALAGLAVGSVGCSGEETPPAAPTPAQPTSPAASRAATTTAPETTGTGPTTDAGRSPAGLQSRPTRTAPSSTLRAAMLSIYFHARYENGDWMPQEFQPMPLEKAATLVNADRSPFATSRRRRAMARLYVAPRTPERLNALQELGTPLAALDARLPAVAGMYPSASDFEAGLRANIQIIISLLENLVALGPEECIRSYPDTDVDFSWTKWTNEARYKMSVRRSVQELGPVLDPQNWAVCAPTFWQTSYVAKAPAGSDLIDPVTNVPFRDSNPPSPGEAWTGMLYEHVVNDTGFTTASFKVLLDVTSTPTPSKHLFEYGLKKSIATAIGPLTKAAGIVIDEGHVVAAQSASNPAMSNIEALKTIKFANFGTVQDFFVNLWTRVALEQMSDEAYEAVCCRP